MPTLDLDKKLKPARKAWKRLKNNLQSKLDQPKILNSIKSFSRRLSLTKGPPPPPPHRLRLSNSLIYVDERFPGPVSFSEPRKAAAESMDDIFQRIVNNPGPGSGLETHHSVSVEGDQAEGGEDGERKNNWDPPSDSRCINERAEEFIAEFRQGMKLERDPRDSRCINERAEEFIAKFRREMKLAAGEDSKRFSSTEKWENNNWDPHGSQCIDERAEEFIAKFRQDMKLERERSVREFEEKMKTSS